MYSRLTGPKSKIFLVNMKFMVRKDKGVIKNRVHTQPGKLVFHGYTP